MISTNMCLVQHLCKSVFIMMVCYSIRVNAWWEISNETNPPYPLSTSKGCDKCESWKYKWGDHSSSTYFNGNDFCNLIGNKTIMMIGDSLTHQLKTSYLFRTKHSKCQTMGSLKSSSRSEKALPIFIEDIDISKNPYLKNNPLWHICVNKIINNPSLFDAYNVTNSSFRNQFQDSDIIIVNQFAHLSGAFTLALQRSCNINDNVIALEFWREQLKIQAEVLFKYKNEKSKGVREVFYRASPASNAAVKLISKVTRLGKSSYDWNKPLSENDMKILTDNADNIEIDTYSGWGHTLYKKVNEMSRNIYSIYGHGYIDISLMMGSRIDAHINDPLHYCIPGVPDIALDEILKIALHKPTFQPE